MRAPRPFLSLLAAAALAVPGGLLIGGAADAALPKAPGATVPATPPSKAVLAGLEVENSFVSSVGWVKPGENYPSRIVVRNTGSGTVSGVRVTIPPTRGMTFLSAKAARGSAVLSGGTISWTLPSVPGGSTTALVVVARAKTLAQEPTLVWRDLSSNARVTVGGTSTVLRSHGPKVIPPSGGFETARYGDRPFPVVPVDYADFKHSRPAAALDTAINSPTNPSSTFSLYQESSYGQLYLKGTLPSLKVKDAAYSEDPAPLRFSKPDPTKTTTCTGVSLVDPTTGEPLPSYTSRVTDGWYQLPGTRAYYGSDANGSALIGAVAGVGALQNIDAGCGPTAKSAYDAAVVADADIDYNDYDTNKDGVVDFFEVIFQGCGGNGASQEGPVAGCPATDTGDNIWPHSSSLENTYVDPVTGLGGYISKDRLKDLEGRLLWYTDTSYTKTTTKDTGDALRAFVRVGPYNVNPETSIDAASVVSHEYGHSLGLPDYYSTGSRETYGDFSVMATDKSQNLDVIAKKELGWVVPTVLPAGTTKVKNWRDSKLDTGTISWVTPQGRPYTLSAKGGDQGVHNGEAYVVTLPGRQLLDPKLITSKGPGKRVYYSGSGNDFGCVPTGGRNLDVAIPGLDRLPAGTKVTATFSSLWDIEWDYDYGFVMTGIPDAQGKLTYTSLPSANGYTTPASQNPNQNSCQGTYGNGITGSSGSYDAGTQALDRTGTVTDTPAPVFVKDSYDLTSLAGTKGVLRFSYATDPGLAKLGWLIDDLKVTATVNGAEKTLYSSDFEKTNETTIYPGGCRGTLTVSGGVCTQGFSQVTAGTPSEQEHAYLLEMRDRSGFDFDGRGQNDRAPIAFVPGVLLTYTDEAHGNGNAGTDNPPAQSPLDAKPTPGSDTPDLSDATFQPGQTYTDAKASPHVDNYSEPSRGANKASGATQNWTFDYDCLSFAVDRLAGNTDNSTAKFDLVGDVTFTSGKGCGKFNYGYGARSVVAPAVGTPAVPPARPRPTTPVSPPRLPATGGLGAPTLAVLLLAGSAVALRRRRTV